jgi:hypothetical protein
VLIDPGEDLAGAVWLEAHLNELLLELVKGQGLYRDHLLGHDVSHNRKVSMFPTQMQDSGTFALQPSQERPTSIAEKTENAFQKLIFCYNPSGMAAVPRTGDNFARDGVTQLDGRGEGTEKDPHSR